MSESSSFPSFQSFPSFSSYSGSSATNASSMESGHGTGKRKRDDEGKKKAQERESLFPSKRNKSSKRQKDITKKKKSKKKSKTKTKKKKTKKKEKKNKEAEKKRKRKRDEGEADDSSSSESVSSSSVSSVSSSSSSFSSSSSSTESSLEYQRKKKKKKKRKLTAIVSKSLAAKEKAIEKERQLLHADPRSTGAPTPASKNFLLSEGSFVPDPPFTVSSTGDRNTLLFRSLYRLDIPSYRASVSHCRGLSKGKSLRLVDGEYREIDRLKEQSKRPPRRYYSKKVVNTESDRQFRRIRIQPGTIAQEDPDNEDFLSFKPSDLAEETADEERQGESLEESLVRRNGEFNAYLDTHPYDITAWLRLVELQDFFSSLYSSSTTGTAQQQASRRALAEKKILIFQRALEYEENAESEELLLAYLHVCSEVWEIESLNALWNKFLDAHPHNVHIWKQYIAFCHSNFAKFSVDTMRNVYGNALEALAAARDAEPLGSPIRPHLDLGLISIFVKFCSFECQSGFTERAVGYWQAALEFNWCRPDLDTLDDDSSSSSSSSSSLSSSSSSSSPIDKLREDFQKFWDSEVPRIGERGAQGWRNWRKQCDAEEATVIENWVSIAPIDSVLAPVLNVEVIEVKRESGEEEARANDEASSSSEEGRRAELRSRERLNRWQKSEAFGDARCFLPLRLEQKSREATEDDEGGGETNSAQRRPSAAAEAANRDPDRVVLSDDVVDALIDLHDENARYELICQAVEFFGGALECRKRSSHQLNLDREEERETLQTLDMYLLSMNETQIIKRERETIATALDEQEQEQLELRRKAAEAEDAALSLSWSTSPRLLRDTWHGSYDFIDQIYRLLFRVASKGNGEAPTPLLPRDWLVVARQQQEQQQQSRSITELASFLVSRFRDDFRLLIAYAQSCGDSQRAVSMLSSAVDALLSDHDANDDDSTAGESDTQLLQSVSLIRCAVTILMDHAGAEKKQESGLDSKKRQSEDGSWRQEALLFLSKLCPDSTDGMIIRRRYRELIFEHFNVDDAQRRLDEAESRSAQSTRASQLVDLIVCAAYFDYLTVSPEVAFETFSASLSLLPGNSLWHERLCECYARLANRHLRHAFWSPGQLRSLIERFLDMYPTNPLFLRLFVRNEAGGRLTARSRRFFDERCPRQRSATLWLFAIDSELSSNQNQNRIRALFERALAPRSRAANVRFAGGGSGTAAMALPQVPTRAADDDDRDTSPPITETDNPARFAPVLWRCYLNFELQLGEWKNAKRVYFRAMRAVPWAKIVWLHPDTFESALSIREAEETIRLMEEKSIRLHCQL